VRYRYRDTLYHIDVRQTPAADAGMKVSADGVAQPDATIRLVDDRQEHYVEVNLQPGQSSGRAPDKIERTKL